MNQEICQTYEYHFRDQKLYQDYYSLCSIGHELWTSPQVYNFNCNNMSEKQCIFQYTVSGEGTIVIDHNTYTLKPGQAFLIERPGPFHYYLSKNSSHWDLKFISINLACFNIWKDIVQKYGRIVTIGEDSSVMQYWNTLYKLSLENKMDNFFITSSYAYSFMMHLNNTLKKIYETPQSNTVQLCLNIIHNNYQKNLTLEDLANFCAISPSQLSKKFKASVKMSPVQYLINHRITMASSLLLRSDLPVADIGHNVGFPDANYFSRIFKKATGVSPREYRSHEYSQTLSSSETQHLSFTTDIFK